MLIKYINNSLHSYRQKTNLNLIKRYVKIKTFSTLHSKYTKIFGFYQYQNLDKIPSTIIIRISSLWLKKLDGCKNIPEKLSITKIHEHILYGWSMPTTWIFDHIENKHHVYRREDCMKTL